MASGEIPGGDMSGPGELTDPQYWDGFWDEVEIPDMVGRGDSFDRSFAPIVDRLLRPRRGGTVAELGCAPGRWLAYCAGPLGMEVTGYDSSPLGMAKTIENLTALKVKAQLRTVNMLEYGDDDDEKFDVVMSMGLIEHFADPLPIVRAHARLAKPGGLVLLEVPNFRGINLWLLKRSHSPLLPHHNLEVMTRSSLVRLGDLTGLNLVESGYIGGFEPQFVDVTSAGPILRNIFRTISTVRRRLPALDRVNHRWFSGYLWAVFERSVLSSSLKIGP